MKRLAVLVALAGLSCAASACRFVRVPVNDLMRAAPVVFVGVVESVTDEAATFQVEHAITGIAEGRQVVKYTPVVSTCSIRFEPGARWLYAGDMQPAGTRWLERVGGPATPDAIGALKREADSALGLPRAWQACSADAQCSPVAYDGCRMTAAVLAHVADARALAMQRGSDPASVKCQPNPDGWRVPKALCVANQCGSWTLGRD